MTPNIKIGTDVTNHISYLDSAVLVKAYRQPFRPLGKVELTKIPVFGFIYKKAIVTVDRSSVHNRAESVRILKSIISKGISVMVFPEGTFNMTNKPLKGFYDGAFRLAIETKTPVKPVLFPHTYSRMNYKNIFSMTPGKCRIIYLEEIPADGLNIGDVQSLKQKVYAAMEKKLMEYKAAWITAAAPLNLPPRVRLASTQTTELEILFYIEELNNRNKTDKG